MFRDAAPVFERVHAAVVSQPILPQRAQKRVVLNAAVRGRPGDEFALRVEAQDSAEVENHRLDVHG
jgi:hypothetical protein